MNWQDLNNSCDSKKKHGIIPYLLQNTEIALKEICKASSQAPNVSSKRNNYLSGKNIW
jgi:hypothetical protein